MRHSLCKGHHMKITDVRQEYFRWEKSRPITNGMHTYTHCGLAVITVETDQEITGYGLSGPVLGINPFMMVDELRNRLIGQDPMRTEWLWDRLYVPKLTGRKGISTRTISGIDMALWDIKAKSLGLPLYRLWGNTEGACLFILPADIMNLEKESRISRERWRVIWNRGSQASR